MAIKDYRLRSMLGPQGVAPRQYDYSFNSQPTPQRRPSFDFDQTSPDVGDLGDVQQAPQKDNASRFYDEIARIRGQATPGTTAYKQALTEMPTPDQYKPNWLTRIASGLSGFSAGMKDAGAGIKTAMSLNRAPYEQAMEQYQNRLGGLKEQYNLESGDTDEQVKDLMTAASMGMKYDDYMLKKQTAEAKAKTDAVTAGARVTTANAAMARATTAAEALKRQGWQSQVQEDGSIVAYNPGTKERQIIPAHSVAAMTAQSGRISANAAASQASTAAGRAGTYATAVKNTGENIQSQINTRKALVNNLQTPASQDKAREVAADEMFNDKQWRKFLEPNATPDDFTDEAWSLFQEELGRRSDEILRKRKQ